MKVPWEQKWDTLNLGLFSLSSPLQPENHQRKSKYHKARLLGNLLQTHFSVYF